MGGSTAARNRLLAGIAVLAMLLIGLLVFRPSFFPRHRHPEARGSAEETPDSSAWRPARVQMAVLFKSYDHVRENVPPRNDTSARQNDWTAPPPPLAILRAAVGTSPHEVADQQVLKWFEEHSGASVSQSELAELPKLLEGSTLSFEAMFRLGSAMQYLQGNHVGAVIHRSAIARAERDYKGISADSPAAGVLRALLPQTGYLWGMGDYATLEQRFAIETTLYPPLSQESRKCAHSRAEAQFYQSKNKEAAETIHGVMERDEKAGDLTRSDREEMWWILGLFYTVAGRHEEAIEPLSNLVKVGNNRSGTALQYLITALAETGKFEEMKARMEEYNERYAAKR